MERSKFKLCVATPIYNGAKYIPRLVESMKGYGVTWIVRDDGSTDDTWEVLNKSVKDTDIKLCTWNGENQGLTYGRNFLSNQFVNNPVLSEFTHMVFIDVDDYFSPGWYETIIHWLNRVSTLYPNEKTPYLCFKYWNERTVQDECQIYTKLNTNYKAHQAVCQYPGGGWDLLHVIPREYLIEVKIWDGNYYHVVKDEKWTPDAHNFLAYVDYKASFIGDIVAILGTCDGNMSDSYYNNVVTKFAKGQVDAAMMFMDIYGSDCFNLGFDWQRIPAHRWRWYLKCLIRMIKNGTLVFSDKKWDDYKTPSDVKPSKRLY